MSRPEYLGINIHFRLLDPEDVHTMILQNTRFTSQHNIKTMRLESSATPYKELKNLQVQSLWGFNSSWTHLIIG